MIRGIRSAVAAMRTQMARQEVLQKNLVNLTVPGYKQEGVAIDGFSSAVSRAQKRMDGGYPTPAAIRPGIGSLGAETLVDRPYVDFQQGELVQTGRTLDVALDGDGFLQVRTPAGDFYSRGGPLRLGSNNVLTTVDGHAVLSTEGEVVLESGNISVASDGRLSVDGEPVARLSVVEFQPGTRLTKVSERLYALEDPLAPGPVEAANTAVMGGFLEGSNVDEASTLSDMTFLLRAYQASQRMLQAQDELLGKAVNEVGRI